MNDRDWFKRRRRGPRGGCALVAGAGLMGALFALGGAAPAALLLGCGGRDAPDPSTKLASERPASAPSQVAAPAEVQLPERLPVPMPEGAPARCIVGAPGRVTVDGTGRRSDGGPVDALLAHPQARTRPDLQGRTALPLLSLVGDLSPGDKVRVTGCDGSELALDVTVLSPWDAVVLVDDRAGGLDLQDAREEAPALRGVSWISRPPG